MQPETKKDVVEESVARLNTFNAANGGKIFSMSELKSFKEKFSEWANQDQVSGEQLKDIVNHWIRNGATESLDLVKTCVVNTYRTDAEEILEAVSCGLISEADAVCISKAERSIIDFVDQDYNKHIDEYQGCLPIWGDDWDYITGFLVDKVQKGMDGESISAKIDQWIEKGAYHFCSFEDALEGDLVPSLEKDKAPLSAQIKSAFTRTSSSRSAPPAKEMEPER